MLLINPSTYIAAFLFLCVEGVLYWAILEGMVNTSSEVLPTVQFFSLFWIPVFFIVPLLTMRSIAGERSAGTLYTLMTTPTSSAVIILSKFAGAYLFYMLLWALTPGFPLLTRKLYPQAAESGALLEIAPMVGSFVFLATSGLLFISIGIFASSITRSQLVAGMLSFTLLFMIVVGGQQVINWVDDVSPRGNPVANYLQIFEHLDDFSRGIIDTRPFFYYGSTGFLLLGLSTLIIETKT